METSDSTLAKIKKRGPGLVLRGICMGTADVIPGVSGGTIALITGIYDELVNSIAAVNGAAVRSLLTGRIAEGMARLNAGFLVPLLGGIGLAIVSLVKLITYLLVTHPQPVWGFFTGLILSSALFVSRQVEKWDAAVGLSLVLGAVFGYVITSLVPMQTGTESYKFFFAGTIAIIAMILPGLSGSFLLVILGKYQQVFTAVDERELGVLLTFGAGCAVGLLAFSRLLKVLLARYHSSTMAFLVGLMLGSLRKVWPFRQVLEEGVVGSGKRVVLRDECIWPGELTAEVWLSLGLIVVGMMLVVVLERLGQRGRGEAG